MQEVEVLVEWLVDATHSAGVLDPFEIRVVGDRSVPLITRGQMILPGEDRRTVVEQSDGELGAQNVARGAVHQCLG